MPIHPNCHLIAVSGGKGGVGKSLLTANLAMAFLQEMKAPTLLVDLDARSCGDQNIIMGLRPSKTARDLAQFSAPVNPQSLKTLITPHPSGLHYVGAVLSPEQTLEAPAELFRKQLHTLSQYYRYILVDIGNEIGELQMNMVDDCSALLLVSTTDVLTVNQTRRLMADLMTQTVPSDLIQIVLNKVNKNGLAPQAIGQALKRPVIGMVPQDDLTAFSSLQRSTPFVLTQPNSQMSSAHYEIVRRLTGGILQKLKSLTRGARRPVEKTSTIISPMAQMRMGSGDERLDPRIQLKLQIHSGLIKEMDLKKDLNQSKGDASKEQELRNKTLKVVSQLTDRLGQGLPRDDRSQIIKEVINEALGLGPLETLLEDSTVSEIMVNGSQQIFIEKSGKLTLSPVTFTSNLQLRNVIERIVTPLGRRIDEKTPYVDARLLDGSRVNAIIEPLAIDGPSLTIRKFPQDRITIEDYYKRFGSMTKSMADFLRICVEQGLNVIISGGTGTGKTTLLNCLSSFIPSNERIITIEDAAELQLKQEHVVRLETRPANMEGTGEISIRDLIKNSLRMRPDRIVVGECRDGAALDMLAAMNTGHDGSMTTVHANTPREAISRLETLCLMAGMDLPIRAIREQVAGAVNLIVQISRLSDGSRKLKSITEVAGMQGETVTLQEIFRFKEEGFDKQRKIIGKFQSTGMIPTFIETFEMRGITIPRNLFTSEPTTPTPGAPPQKKSTGLSRPTLSRPPTIKKTGTDGGRK